MAYIGRQGVIGNFVKLDAISVVNGQAAYTMQNNSVNFTDYSTVNQFLVSLNGTVQSPGSSFTVSSSTITFSSNLVTGDVINFIIVFGNSLSAGTPTDGTVTNAKIVYPLTKSGATVSTFNRTTSVGNTIEIQKDGTTVGAIGTKSASIFIDSLGNSAQSGIEFDGDTIVPRRNGSVADNEVNLGYSGTKFKDLTLGGGVYLGGTGTANKLEDYEEGTWSPTLTTDAGGGNSGVTFGDRFGSYTKIGNVVTVHVFINLDAVVSMGSGNSIVATLPFNSTSTSPYRSAVSIGYAKNWGETPSSGTISNNTNVIYLRKRNSASALDSLVNIVSAGNMNATSEIILTATYQTDA